MQRGSHSLIAIATDAAGNRLSTSQNLEINIEDSHLISPTAVASITDGGSDANGDSFNTLDEANDIATTTIGGNTYALISAFVDNGVQIVVISNPARPIAVATITDGIGGFDELNGSMGIVTTTIGDDTYALIASEADDGVQIANLEDSISPSLTSSSPADNATAVAVDSSITLTFSEAVDVETGNIIIKKIADRSTVENIAVGSGQVTGSGTNQININPSTDFESSTGYYLQIDATAFDDPSGNSYAGISDTTTLSFTSADVIAPDELTNLDLSANSDTGRSNSDNITSNTKPTITGRAEAGSTIKLYWRIFNTRPISLVGNSITDGNGDWSITSTELASGLHDLLAEATDTAGNTSVLSRSLLLTFDLTAPIITSTDQAESIDENSGSEQLCFTAKATDDCHFTSKCLNNVLFSLKPGNNDEAAAFSIDSISGEVILNENPDHETRSTYGFTIVATDVAGNFSEQDVTLNINDLAEDEPEPDTEPETDTETDTEPEAGPDPEPIDSTTGDNQDVIVAIQGFPAIGYNLTATLSSSDSEEGLISPSQYRWELSSDGTNWRRAGARETFKVKQKHGDQSLRLQLNYPDAEGSQQTVFSTISEVSSGLLLPLPDSKTNK